MNIKKILQQYQLTDRDLNRIVEMAWEDRTPFDAIEAQFGVTEAEVIRIMKHQMHLRNWKKWRARVQGRQTKHRKLRGHKTGRFKASRQKQISLNKISKR
ncbi:MAG: TIGR03643 family protein [Phaeodactylibacter sp.]|nr:TIGR03643 family protein [Phaeodactylibacter sp.]